MAFDLKTLDRPSNISKSKEQHWEHLLRALFSILATNRWALNLEKWVFTIAELDFLGHRISAAASRRVGF